MVIDQQDIHTSQHQLPTNQWHLYTMSSEESMYSNNSKYYFIKHL
jgi:hypothetical protein